MILNNYIKIVLLMGLFVGYAEEPYTPTNMTKASPDPVAESSTGEFILGGMIGVFLVGLLLIKSFEAGIEATFGSL